MNQTEAAHAVLIEVMNVLGAFKDDLVIVGGWVPELLYPDRDHIGSLDVDLAVAPTATRTDAYSTLLARLTDQGYSHTTNPTRFLRQVPGVDDPIKVDLVCGQSAQGTESGAIVVNELLLNSLRGIDLAFRASEEIVVEGIMPDGTQNVVRARIVRPEAFILIKAFALAERTKPKDAYDVAFVLQNYEPTLAELAAALRPLIADGLGAEAYQILMEKFSTFDSVGPDWAASVAEEAGEERHYAQQSAYMNAQELFEQIQMLAT